MGFLQRLNSLARKFLTLSQLCKVLPHVCGGSTFGKMLIISELSARLPAGETSGAIRRGYFSCSIAACAAARRAIGTRNGEQDT